MYENKKNPENGYSQARLLLQNRREVAACPVADAVQRPAVSRNIPEHYHNLHIFFLSCFQFKNIIFVAVIVKKREILEPVLRIRDVLSRIPDPDPTIAPSRIPDPGSKKAPDPGSDLFFTQAINKFCLPIPDPGSGSDHCSIPDPGSGSATLIGTRIREEHNGNRSRNAKL
jgi:hypothetical protein